MLAVLSPLSRVTPLEGLPPPMDAHSLLLAGMVVRYPLPPRKGDERVDKIGLVCCPYVGGQSFDFPARGAGLGLELELRLEWQVRCGGGVAVGPGDDAEFRGRGWFAARCWG